ncbi:MAG: hypothetical protein ACI4EA_04615 [Candidatus Ornithomonoglobus sp.]
MENRYGWEVDPVSEKILRDNLNKFGYVTIYSTFAGIIEGILCLNELSDHEKIKEINGAVAALAIVSGNDE